MPFTGILTCCLFCISDLMCFVSVRCVCVWFFLWISVFTPESSSTTPFSYISSLAQCHVRHETDRSQAFVDDVPFDLWHKCSLLYDYTMSHCAYFPYLLPSTFLHELCSFFLPSKKCVYDGVMNIQSSALDLCVSCSSHISIDIHKIHIRKIIIRYFGWSCDWQKAIPVIYHLLWFIVFCNWHIDETICQLDATVISPQDSTNAPIANNDNTHTK